MTTRRRVRRSLGALDRARVLPLIVISGGVLVALGAGYAAAKGAAAVYDVFSGKSGFVTGLWSALAAFPALSRNTKILIIAQAAHESGWGKGTAAKAGYNFWNLTAGSAWTGAITGGGDLECDATGANCRPITQKFRKYASVQAAIIDYLSFLSTQNGGRYLAAYNSLIAGDATAFFTNLRAGGYYTQALNEYLAGAKGAINTVVQYV